MSTYFKLMSTIALVSPKKHCGTKYYSLFTQSSFNQLSHIFQEEHINFSHQAMERDILKIDISVEYIDTCMQSDTYKSFFKFLLFF